MKLFFGIVAFVLYLYLLIVLARVSSRSTRSSPGRGARSGVAAIGLEIVYVATDPPVRLLRRLVPPLRMGLSAST